nr:helix-turn-helix domain-containing protein [Streptomyces cavernae]
MSHTEPATAAAPRESKLVRGLNLLNCFGPDEDLLRLSQLADRARVPLPTAHRLVHELELCGMLERFGGHLRLGRSLAQLGRRAQGHLHTLLDDALPLLVRLHAATGLDVVFSACYGSQALPIGQLSRLGGTSVVSYAPQGSPINSLLVAAALRRHDSGCATPQVISSGELTGVGAAIRPRGTAIRAVIALIGRSGDAVSAAVPHVHAVARALNERLGTVAPLAPAAAAAAAAPDPCPETPSMLARGLSLLNGLRAGEARVTLTELAHRTGLPKSTAHRLISVLIDYQFLQEGGAGIMFGPRVLALSAQVPARRLLRTTALPWQRLLCEQSDGFSCLLIPDPPTMDRLTCVFSDGPVATAIGRGAPGLAERLSTAAARATMREVDPTGPFGLFAEDLAEPAPPPPVVGFEHGCAMATAPGGLTAIAAPVLTRREAPEAVLTLVMQAPGLGKVRTAVREARAAAADIARACAGLPASPTGGLPHTPYR